MREDLKPKPVPPTPDWAEAEFKLPAESGDIYGQYVMDYVPYMYGIYAALDDPNIPEIVVQKAAQIGWTFGLIAWIFKQIVLLPCVIIGMFAKEGAAKKFHDEKLEPAIKATSAISKIIDTSGSRKSTNTTSFKKFPNGFLSLVSSKSISDVKSTPAKIVFVEEPDDSTQNLQQQGNSIKLLWERTKRKKGKKKVMGGTPSTEGLSKIGDHIKRSDKRVLPVTCHECDREHVLDFKNVSWFETDEGGKNHEVYGTSLPDTAVYVCPECGSPWDDYQRKVNIRKTVRQAMESGDPLCGWKPTADYYGIAGFIELSELYSCLPGSGLSELVSAYLSAEYEAGHGDETERIVFQNSNLARLYEYKDDKASKEELEERALDYPENFCPSGGLLMTVGIDVQHDRVAIVKRAFGRQEESWGILWKEIYAQSACTDNSDPIWDDLEKLVFEAVEHESGNSIFPSAVSIDSSDGHTNDAVYSWVRKMAKRHRSVLVMAIKGASSQKDPEIFATPSTKGVDHKNPKKQSKADKYGLKVYLVGTNKAKDYLAGHMKLEGFGPGRHHQSKHVRADYWDQVTGEIKAPHRTVKNKKVWQQKAGSAVEAWDCEVYALHAARARRVHLKSATDWDSIERTLLQSDLFSSHPERGEVEKKKDTKVAPDKSVSGQPKVVNKQKSSNGKSLLDIARRMNR